MLGMDPSCSSTRASVSVSVEWKRWSLPPAFEVEIKTSEGICKLLDNNNKKDKKTKKKKKTVGHLSGSATVGGGQDMGRRIFGLEKAQLLSSTPL